MVIGNNGLALFPSTKTVPNEHIKLEGQEGRGWYNKSVCFSIFPPIGLFTIRTFRNE